MPVAADSRATALERDTILQRSHDHIVIADGEGRVLRASASCTAVYGVSAEALVGASVYDLEREGVFSPSITAEVLRTRAECQLMQHTRTGRSVMAEAYPVWDGDRLVRVISFSKDMTDIQLLQREYELLQRRLAARETPAATDDMALEGLHFRSAIMRELVSLLQRVAPTDANVLLLGESGVGKTAFATLLHRHSPRCDGPFVEANCGAIPETLFESEVFGYVTGAFSGASREGKPGLAEQADGGTLFLDEIAELPLAVQAKLLKVIQDGRVTRLGSTRPGTIDFRLVGATNQDLERLVAEGRFRADLYYRLNVVPVTIPPLRERREDIPVLVNHVLAGLNERYGGGKVLAPECWQELLSRDWPGNVRELENRLERLYVASEGDVIQATAAIPAANADAAAPAPPAPAPGRTLAQAVAEAEREALTQALRHCRSTYEVAEYLGTSQPTVFRKLKKYGLRVR
ncbi:sigma-54 interaction domain-containing protein [Arhodomonas sp. AD133]|uniref:sigma-54 interaction domain-containing protein n=1 Tax=Arhodomonas sp. AD133 TaxID=3415009 RepID=UPI003EB79DED